MVLNRVFAAFLILLCCAQATAGTPPQQHPIVIHPEFDETVPIQRSIYPYKNQKRPRIALVLSGGGARGVAQIGVLKALEQHNIPIDCIVATSLGAVVGGLYASGYTTAELESLALNTDWDEVLSLTEETRRRDLFIDQKLADDRSMIAIRFEGFEPVLPSAISTGQRLTDFLSTLTLQALYHPDPTFDDLKIPFRAVATDLISGQRVVIRDGSLAEALRASATVPLLFSPIRRDTMQLIDGGLVSNIPADVAREEGYDIVIVVNSTSGLRNADELIAPWQAADQIMGIMMQVSNSEQMARADVVITPDIGKHLSSNFTGLDALIAKGEEAAEAAIERIRSLYRHHGLPVTDSDSTTFPRVRAEESSTHGNSIPDSLWRAIEQGASDGHLSLTRVRRHVRDLYDAGMFKNVWAEIETDSVSTRVVYHVEPNPTLVAVEFVGCSIIPERELQEEFRRIVGKSISIREGRAALEGVLQLYRSRGYSLARVRSTVFDEDTGVLRVFINEGVVQEILLRGEERTVPDVVLREFPIRKGDVFEIDQARKGLRNIASTGLFEYVYLEISYAFQEPTLIIRLSELPSRLVRLGLRIDNERNFQASIDVRDDNLGGTGSELGLRVSGGGRNAEAILDHGARRIFDTYLTFNVALFTSFFDSHIYDDAPRTRNNRWSRKQVGEYRDIRYGARVMFGSHLERLGNVTAEYSLQRSRIKSLLNASGLEESYRLAFVRVGTVLDSKNSYPFPTSGIGLSLSYEFAFESIGSEVSYTSLKLMYEQFTTWGGRHTFHPRLTLGFADRTMPFGQQFRFGGRESFFGLREDDRRGRQLLLANIEYAYLLPRKLLFDTYLRVRYDLGFISAIPEEIKWKATRHGVGAELAFDTPFGPAMLGLGQSFQFGRELPDNPLQLGDLHFYFMIGYGL